MYLFEESEQAGDRGERWRSRGEADSLLNGESRPGAQSPDREFMT